MRDVPECGVDGKGPKGREGRGKMVLSLAERNTDIKLFATFILLPCELYRSKL